MMARSIDESLRPYFSGEKLYGDDFDDQGIYDWFVDEAEGYADLGAKEKDLYRYEYHGINRYHGYRWLGDRSFENVLGMGSAYGDELMPIIGRIGKISILDSSEAFNVTAIGGVPVSYHKAESSGDLPFDDNSFGLITCFGVQHHIPNVSHVLGEMFRCLSVGGVALIREPTTSMGDWRSPRPGLTKRERGLPQKLFGNMLASAGFCVKRAEPCFFPVVRIAGSAMGLHVYNHVFSARIDHWLSKAFAWNYAYYRPTKLSKMAPGCGFWLVSKEPATS